MRSPSAERAVASVSQQLAGGAGLVEGLTGLAEGLNPEAGRRGSESVVDPRANGANGTVQLTGRSNTGTSVLASTVRTSRALPVST